VHEVRGLGSDDVAAEHPTGLPVGDDLNQPQRLLASAATLTAGRDAAGSARGLRARAPIVGLWLAAPALARLP
jgi:hypothetical protein